MSKYSKNVSSSMESLSEVIARRERLQAEEKEGSVSSNANNANNANNTIPEIRSELVLEIADVAWFLIKNDQRKQLYAGGLKIITHPTSADFLIFVFESSLPSSQLKKYTHVLSKQCLVMKIFDRNYIFGSNEEFYGLILDVNTSCEAILALEAIIEQYSRLKVKMGENRCSLLQKYKENEDLYCGPPDQVALMGLKLADYIRAGTVQLVTGIRFVSEKSTTGLKAGSNKLKDRIVPNEEPLKVSATTQSHINKAKFAGKAAAKVSSALVTGAVAAANALSSEISSSFSKSDMGQKIVCTDNPKMKAAKEVVKSTVAGIATIVDETISAGLQVVREASSVTADVVGHKYGTEVHEAAKSVGDIVSDTATAAVNVNRLGVSALAKRVAATATVDVLSTETERQENQKSRVQIDPITGMQVLMVANQLGQISENRNNENRNQRHEYIGLRENNPQENSYQNHEVLDVD